MVLVVDPQIAGISGDMFLCALVDLGADQRAVIDGVQESAAKFLDGSTMGAIEFRRTGRAGTSALELNIESHDPRDLSGAHGIQRSGADMADAIRRSAACLGLSDAASAYASGCIDILVRSESKVHGVDQDAVLFHEASDVDTIVDIIGTAIALDDLGLFDHRIVCLPVCVGGGSVTFSHGTTSNPAGAILQIFKEHKLWMRGSSADCELTTPTGACMLAALHPEAVSFYPHIRVNSVGYGAGLRAFEEFANVLKLVYGSEPHLATDASSLLGAPRTERVCMLETNVDDVSGEVLGNIVGKVMDAGAMDVSIYHGLTKKNRPSSLVSVMCSPDASGRLTDMLISETGTLGVRISESERVVVPREVLCETVALSGKQFEIRYKKRRGRGAAGFKIEFDDLKAVSDALNVPVREAESLLRREIEKRMDCIKEEGAGPDETTR